MNVTVDDDVPVVMFVQALAYAGLELAQVDGQMVIRLSTQYLVDGETFGGFVPAFLRYRPARAFLRPQF